MLSKKLRRAVRGTAELDSGNLTGRLAVCAETHGPPFLLYFSNMDLIWE